MIIFILSYKHCHELEWITEAFASKAEAVERLRDVPHTWPLQYSICEYKTHLDENTSYLELLVYLEQINPKIKNFPPLSYSYNHYRY